MRRLISVAILAVAVVAGSILVTSANADDRGKRDRGGETLHLTVRTVDSVDLDLGEEGFTVGDRFVFEEKVFKHRRQVGSAHGECTAVVIDRRDNPTFQCLVVLVLDRKGTLTAHGLLDSSARNGSTFAVTGGTGRFKGAGGEAHVREIDEDKARLRIKLVD